MDSEREDRILSERSDYLIRHLTLRQLQIFEAIVRQNSFTKAAEELFLTQPTVSMQMKKLTDIVGLPLLEVADRKNRPTEVGEALFDACQKIFDVLNELENFTAAYKGLRRGRLRLGVITTAKYFAPEILGGFCNLYPEVDVSLKVTNRARLHDRIRQGLDDLYIVGSPLHDEQLVEIPFAPNPVVVVASKRHPLTRERDIPFQRLGQESWIVREVGSGLRDLTMGLLREHDLHPKIRMELGSNEAIKQAVAAGLGVSMLSLHTLTLEGAIGPLDILDVKDFPIQRHWYLVYSRERPLSLLAQTFLEFVQQKQPEIEAVINKLLADFSLIHQDRWRNLGL